MAIFLRFQLEIFKSYSIRKAKNSRKIFLAGVLVLCALFCSKDSYATNYPCLGGAAISSPSPTVCSGDSLTLTLTGTTGALSPSTGPWTANYQWDSSQDGGATWGAYPGASGTITSGAPVATFNTHGLTAGVMFRVALTGIINPCVGGSTLTTNSVTISILPRPAVITGNPAICVGATTTLSDATTGGTWSSSTTSVATIGTSGVVFGVSGGTTTISYMAAGCPALQVVTVNATAPITGTTTLCAGSTSTLSDATPGGTWTSTTTSVATIDGTSGVVTGVSGGATTIVYTSPANCASITTVSVNSLPSAITGSLGVCIGLTTSLSDGTPGGAWVSGNTGVATIVPSGVVTTVATGTSTITYALPSTGCYVTAVLTVNPLPNPITSTTSFNVCQASTTTLSDVGGGTWSSSNTAIANTTSGGVVTGVSGGTATITYTLPTGCITTAGVTVNPIALITGNTNVCLGFTSALSNAIPGGTWTSSNTVAATVGSATGIVNGLSLGSSVIFYTTPAGCSVNTTINVDPNPNAISGPSTVCQASSITLSDAGGGTWATSNGGVAIVGGTTGVVTGVTGGTAIITYTLPTSCYTTTALTVNPVSPITGPSSACVGTGIDLTDLTAGGTWTSTNTAVATVGTDGSVTTLSAGTTTISYALPSGCSVAVTITVNPTPAPIGGNLNVCAWGGTTALTETSTGGVWSSTLVVVDPFTGLVTAYSTGAAAGASGTGTVSYTLPTGCAAYVTVTINPLPAPVTGNTTVCQGSNTLLSDATPGGTWSSNDITIATAGSGTGIITGIAGGSTTITYTLSTGCTADTTVTVLPLPSAMTGADSVCVGLTTALSSSTGGGAWTSSNTGIATVTSTGVVTGIAQGTATISYALPTGCTGTVTVTVNPLPAVITGTFTVCQGSTTTLSDVTPGGSWTSGNTFVATVGSNTGVVTGRAGGIATITYLLPTGCIQTAVVTVNPITAISGSDSVCIGSMVTLSDGTPGGTWASSDGTIATIGSSTGIITGVATGSVTITYTLATGCTASVSVTVNAVPLPITGTTTVCAHLVTTLSDATPGGTWSSSNNTVATVDAAGNVTGVSGGFVTITYQIPTGGCYATTPVTVNPSVAITGTTTVCQGQVTTLSNSVPGGTWSTSDATIATVDPAGNVTGVGAGTATISYILPTGCTATTTVTVNALAPIMGGNADLCTGLTTILTDAVLGGTWSSSNTVAATIDPFGTVTGVAPGVDTFYYILPSGCTASTTLTINSLAAITGPSTVCVGDSILLIDTTPGGIWSSGNSSIASVNTTGGVDGVSSGTTIISYSFGTSCVQIHSVVVNPITAIYGNPVVCPGLTTTLFDTTAGGVWSSSDVTVATVGSSTGVVAGVNPGTTATIFYITPTGCSASVVVTVEIVYPIAGNTGLCMGSTSTLTNFTTGGTWTSSNGSVATVNGTSGLVTSVGLGTTSITYTLPSGCVATAVVTVNPLPGPITGPTQVCAYGGTITLSDTTAGGTWSSTLATIDPITGLLTGQAPGLATISYTLPTGCSSYYLVTVNPLPANITGFTTVCVGLSTTLSDPTAGGTWVSGNPGIAIVGSSNGIVTGISAGSAHITYVLSTTGCGIDTLVNVNPIPLPIGGNPSICLGSSNLLTEASGGGFWSSSNTFVATVDIATGLVTSQHLGTSTITYTFTSTGCLNTLVVTVNPLPAAITGIRTVCVGQTTTLNDITPGGTWLASNGNATVGSSTGIVTGVTAGLDNIIYLVTATGCTAVTVVTINPLAPITGTTSFCFGGTVTLSDAIPGGTWTSSNTAVAVVGTDGTVTSGTTSGTVTISYSLPDGCTATTVITVNPLPALITGTPSVCQGLTTTLNDATGGGTWTSSLTGIATIGSTGIVTGINPGTTVIAYTLGTGCTTSIIFTVNPMAPNTGSTSVCAGQTITLSNPNPGGAWISSSTTYATVDLSGNVTGVAAGTATISYILPTGCISTTAITINALAPINGTTDLCTGVTTIFTDSVPAGTWSSSNPAVATVGIITGIVNGVTPGVAVISCTLPSGCIATISVTVTSLAAITGSGPVCTGDSIFLADATPGGIWSTEDSTIATVSNTGVVHGIRSGTDIISYSYGPGCVRILPVIVNPITPIMGNLNICLGFTTTLTDSTLNGTWSSSNIAIANVNTIGVVTGYLVGTATISYTSLNGCVTMAVVTVNQTAAIVGPDSVCVGLTTTLTDATPSGVWSSSNTAVATVGSGTGVVLGISTPGAFSTGTTTITYTDPLGCYATVTVTVDPLPLPITGTLTVCYGLNTLLADGFPGGTWSSSNATIASVGSTGLVHGVQPGTATITYTLPTGCINTAVVTVNPLPQPITGTDSVCVGSSITLSDATPSGTWRSSNIGYATVGSTSGIVTGISGNGLAAGIDTITYTLTTTGCISTFVVSVNPLPGPILGNPNACIGLTYIYTDTVAGGIWSTNDTNIIIDAISGTVVSTSLGIDTITYTLSTGCLVSYSLTVDPIPSQIYGPDSVCVGSNVSLIDTTVGGTWTSSNTTIATVVPGTGLVTGDSAGVAIITYTLGTGCISTYPVTVDPLPGTITGNHFVCLGYTTTLFDVAPLGVWTSSNTAVATVDSFTGVVTSVTLGTATITYTLHTTCYVTTMVTVTPLPAPITGTDSVCVGFTTLLHDTSSNGSWISNLPGIASVDTGLVTANSSGVATISYILNATGCFVTTHVTVNRNPIPITGRNQVCVNSTIIDADTLGGVWTSSFSAIASLGTSGVLGDSIAVFGNSAGTATITYTFPTGCYATFHITVNPLPANITGTDTVCVGSTVTLVDTTTPPGTWYANPSSVATIDSVVGIVTGISAGTVLITYQLGTGCLTNYVVTVHPLPSPITGTLHVCDGLSLALSDLTPHGTWTSTNTGIATVIGAGPADSIAIVTGITVGVDTIIYTLPTTCKASVSFTVNPIPVIEASANPKFICKGGSTTLSASDTVHGDNIVTWLWTPNYALSSTSLPTTTATPTISTTYTITGTSQFGCVHDTTIRVWVDSALYHIKVTGRPEICDLETDTLVASGYGEPPYFTWQLGLNLDCTVCDTVHAMPHFTTTYTVAITDSFYCKDSVLFTVIVHPLPDVHILPNPAIVCRGSSTQLTATDDAPGDISTFVWFPNAFLSCYKCYNPIASDTQNLSYVVTATSQYGCVDSSIPFPVSVLDTNINTISNDTILCKGESAQLQAISMSPDGSRPDFWLWAPNDGSLNHINVYNPIATPQATTTYTVTIKENVCFTKVETVTVFVEPVPLISLSPSVTVIAGQSVQLNANINNEVIISHFIWTPASGLSCDVCYNPIATPTATTTYSFTATTNYGCADSGSVTIKLKCDNINQVFVPNTFTPNGDGVNDRFYVSGIGIGTINRLSVYNRWGELVFESHNTSANDPGAGWDGTYKGSVLEPDVFVWVAEMTCELGGTPYKFKGDISIVR